jgi:hypothetical protein
LCGDLLDCLNEFQDAVWSYGAADTQGRQFIETAIISTKFAINSQNNATYALR